MCGSYTDVHYTLDSGVVIYLLIEQCPDTGVRPIRVCTVNRYRDISYVRTESQTVVSSEYRCMFEEVFLESKRMTATGDLVAADITI